jgi:hypothetical protein
MCGTSSAPSRLILLLGCLTVLAACEKEGIDALPDALRPVAGQPIDFYRIGSIRCPYWISGFTARDGRKGGARCVNRETLKTICDVAECTAKAGDPPAEATEATEATE